MNSATHGRQLINYKQTVKYVLPLYNFHNAKNSVNLHGCYFITIHLHCTTVLQGGCWFLAIDVYAHCMFNDISPGSEMGAHLKLLFYHVATLMTWCFIFSPLNTIFICIHLCTFKLEIFWTEFSFYAQTTQFRS